MTALAELIPVLAGVSITGIVGSILVHHRKSIQRAKLLRSNLP